MNDGEENAEDLHSLGWWLDREMTGTKVRVHTQNHTYEGWVHVWDHDSNSLLLVDSYRDDGKNLNRVTVNQPDCVEELGEVRHIKEVPIEDVRPSAYDARREHDTEDVTELSHPPKNIREIHLSGNLFYFPYPTVRPVAEGKYELMSGHRRTAATRQAQLESIPVRVFDFDDWEATCRFVFNHFPFPRQLPDQPEDLYSESEMRFSFELLREDWSDEQLMELPQLRGLLEEQDYGVR